MAERSGDDGSPVWIRQLFEVVRPVIPAGFVGRVEVNVFKGGIANVNVVQSYKGESAKSA